MCTHICDLPHSIFVKEQQNAVPDIFHRGIQEGHHGWTMLLHEENDVYEYAGYDYVLDLISEMELEPDFPHNWSYYITGVVRPTETSSLRRETKKQYVIHACTHTHTQTHTHTYACMHKICDSYIHI